jgi:hypothetical protein
MALKSARKTGRFAVFNQVCQWQTGKQGPAALKRAPGSNTAGTLRRPEPGKRETPRPGH